MGKAIIWCVLLVWSAYTTFAQTHVRRILLPSLQEETWPLLGKDTAIIQANSTFQLGSNQQKTALPEQVNPDSLFRNSRFSKKHIARSDFNLESFPVSTSLQIIKIEEGQSYAICSGSMIGEQFALSAGHCFIDIHTNTLLSDSIYVSIIRDKGSEHPDFPLIRVKSISIIEPFTISGGDAVLLELEKELGLKSGWLGIGYDKSNAVFDQKLFHKFSYPGTYMPSLDSQYYTGQDLFYSFGELDYFNEKFIGTENGSGIPGESGSSIILGDQAYISYGVLSLAHKMSHSRIHDYTFYSFQHIMNESPGLTVQSTENSSLEIYPNPIKSGELLHLDFPQNEMAQQVRMYSIRGQLIKSWDKVQNARISILGIPAGVYKLVIISSKRNYSRTLVVQ